MAQVAQILFPDTLVLVRKDSSCEAEQQFVTVIDFLFSLSLK